MANRNFPSQRIFGFHMLPVRLDCSVQIGASGAVSSFSGKGIAAVTRLSAGIYQIQLQDNYFSYLTSYTAFESPVTGSAIAGGSFVATTIYQIVTVGSTTQAQWHAAGVPAGITAAPGVVFKAATIGAGSGTVKALGSSGISAVEMIGQPATMISNQPFNALQGGYLTYQCLASTTPTDPASGSVMNFEIYMNNSSVQ